MSFSNTSEWAQKEDEVAYVGGIARIRGAEEIVGALEYTQGVRLNLAGQFSEKAVEEKGEKSLRPGRRVNELGFSESSPSS